MSCAPMHFRRQKLICRPHRYYVAADRSRAEKMLKKAIDLGMHSIWLTVDAPVVSGLLNRVAGTIC